MTARVIASARKEGAASAAAGRPGELGFGVDALLERARMGGALRMGLMRIGEQNWLDPLPDLAIRARGLDRFGEGVQRLGEAQPAERELAELLGVAGGIEAAARSHWEDMCLLLPAGGGRLRLVACAVAFPSDWHPARMIGRELGGVHSRIHGYREKLQRGVDHFFARLAPGEIYARSNWFITPSGDWRWLGARRAHEAFAHVTCDNAGEALFVRCERQAFRCLPQSGAILFTIGIYLAPLAQVSPAGKARLARAMDFLSPQEADRRGVAHYAAALKAHAAKANTQARKS